MMLGDWCGFFQILIAFFLFLFRFLVTSMSLNFEVNRWSKCPEPKREFLKLFGISVEHCVFECSVRTNCKSVGYKRRMSFCVIHFEDVSNDFAGSDSCDFIRRDDIDIQEVEAVCTCSDGQVCDVDTGQCVFKECNPFDVTNGRVYGNVWHIDARHRIKCDKGFVETNGVYSTVCGYDGNWDYNPSCVLPSSITTDAATSPQTTAPTSTPTAAPTTTTTTTAAPPTTTPTTAAPTTTTSTTAVPPTATTTTATPTTTTTTTAAPPTTTTTTAAHTTTTTTTAAPTTTTSTTAAPTTTTTTTAAATTTTSTTAAPTTTTTTTAAPTTTTTTTPIAVCPSDWTHPASDSTFNIKIFEGSFKHSQTSCQSSLAKIDGTLKQTFVANTLANCAAWASQCFWIDGNKVSGVWQFTDGSSILNINDFWDSGQPGGGGLDCISLNENQRWASKNCNNRCNYICQQ